MTRTTVLNPNAEILVRASQLVPSPLNVRKTERPKAYIEGLAASIKANGLMHPLQVHAMPVKRGKELFGVAAGGGRHEAIQVLMSRGDLDDDKDLVRCVLVETAAAVRISAAENVHREALHPADEFEAFKRMIDGGDSIEDTAAAFGVTPLVVRRRLRLASVAPTFLDLFRADNISLDEMMALATTTDHALQVQVWEQLAEHYHRGAGMIRRAIAGSKLDASADPVARFIGIEAYAAAGGELEQDLFSDKANAGFIVDVPLLHSLARAQLEEAAQAVRAEGWAWVQVALPDDGVDYYGFARAARTTREPTKKEAKAIAAIDKVIREFHDSHDDFDDEQEAWLDERSAERSILADALEVYSDEVKAAAGAVVTIEAQTGKLDVWRGLIRAEDRKAAQAAAKGEAALATKAKVGLSEALTRRLTAHRTRAAQAVLATRPDVAVALLAYRLVAPRFYAGVYGVAECLQLRIDQAPLQRDADDLDSAPATLALEALHTEYRSRLPKKLSELFCWLLAQPQADVVALITFCLSGALLAVQSSEKRNAETEAVIEALDFDMADWWKPTAGTYLNYVKRDDIAAVVKQVVSPAAGKEILTLKKSEAVSKAETLLSETRWLPKVLCTKKPKAAQ